MNFHVRFGTLLDQKTDPASLIARQILIDDSAARQDQRKLIIGNFIRRIVFNRVEPGFAVRVIKAIFKKTRRAGMIFSRTGPEDAVVLFDFLPGYSVVIR